MSFKSNPTAVSTPSKAGSFSPIVLPSPFTRASARSKARHSSGPKSQRGAARADQRRAGKCQFVPSATPAAAMRTRPAVGNTWLQVSPAVAVAHKTDAASLAPQGGVYHHPHYRHPSSSEPTSPLLRAASGSRQTSAATQQRGAVPFRRDQHSRPSQLHKQQRGQLSRTQAKGPHHRGGVARDGGGDRPCDNNGKDIERTSPIVGNAVEPHRYGQQPRHPEESAPASSRPTSLEDFNLPFQVGEFVVDPETRTHYQLKKLLGRGAYALVWEAQRTTDNTLVALKALSTKSLTPEQRELQRLEAQLHAEAYAHAPSSVVPFFATWVQPDDHWVWICLGKCTNGDLYTWLTDGPGSSSHLGLHLRSKFWLEILTAVQQVHEIGIGHRDLKPENYLISTKNSIMLTDFGLATKDTLSTDWECGSRPYMAPEVCERGRRKTDAGQEEDRAPEPYDPRASDVWSLGIVYLNLHHLCSAWSSPDASCRVFHHFVQNPDAWLEEAGVENGQVREWLMTKVFVRPSLRCSVAEWLSFEKSRKLPGAAAKQRSFHEPVMPANATAILIPRGTAVPTARTSAKAAPMSARLAVSLPAETPGKPMGGVAASVSATASDTPPVVVGPRPTSAGSATAAKRRHRRRPSWAYDLDFDENDGKMDFSASPVFAIEDVSEDEDPFVARDKNQAAEAAEHTKAST